MQESISKIFGGIFAGGYSAPYSTLPHCIARDTWRMDTMRNVRANDWRLANGSQSKERQRISAPKDSGALALAR